ncbi:hypothetical protein RB195_020612 [Necator americanus]|uniref:Uncharacterized protein n=1 Tax=Necator americanus TaxID=51031 RepID=A0ABR1CJN7_NECAM
MRRYSKKAVVVVQHTLKTRGSAESLLTTLRFVNAELFDLVDLRYCSTQLMSIGISREMPSPVPEIWSSDEWMDSVRALAVDREGLDRAVFEDNRKKCGQAHQAIVSARRLCQVRLIPTFTYVENTIKISPSLNE